MPFNRLTTKRPERFTPNKFVGPENFIDRKMDEILPEEIAWLTHQKIAATQQHKKVETYEYQLSIENEVKTFESGMV